MLAPTMKPVTSKLMRMNLPCEEKIVNPYISNSLGHSSYICYHISFANLRIGKSCHSWWSWHYRRPLELDWPAVVAFPAHPTVPGLKRNENQSIENKSRRKKWEEDMPEDWNKTKELRWKGSPLE